MMSAIEGGNFHTVKVGEQWRLQTLRVPYICPVLEENGVVFEKVQHAMLTREPGHEIQDDCCYYDVIILSVDEDVIRCRTAKDDRFPGEYMIFEVLNDDTIVRFYTVRE